MFPRSARRQPTKKKQERQKAGPKTEVHFFDFDHTFFQSPGPPPDIPKSQRGKFWHDPRSLGGELVPEDPNLNWYIQQVVEAYQRARKNPRAHVVVITGRSEPFRDRIMELLRKVGEPDELVLKQKREPTRGYKIREMKRVMEKMPAARRIHFYEDRESHLRSFQEAAEEEGFRFTPHFVQEDKPERTWDQFMWAMYEGGAKQVPNTNPESRDQYPTVRADYLLKNDPRFAEFVRRRFRQWVSAGKPIARRGPPSVEERVAEGEEEETERIMLSLELDLEPEMTQRVARRWLLASVKK